MSKRNLIYSKRYTPPWEEDDVKALAGAPQTPEKLKAAKESFREFMRKLQEESTYIPIPGAEEKSRLFIALAKRLSQIYELDIDIEQQPYFVCVSFHLYCASYPGGMTREFSELFSLCDQFASIILTTEKSDFTLSLTLYTHKHYISGRLVNF